MDISPQAGAENTLLPEACSPQQVAAQSRVICVAAPLSSRKISPCGAIRPIVCEKACCCC
jgi:hypothetical protein